jgi:hypothetical protein
MMARREIPPQGRRYLGIDFSGASDAGRKIWIAEGRRPAGAAFHLDSLLPACDLPGGAVAAAPAMAALRACILAEPDTVAGCDFPFSLPAGVIDAARWVDFVREFPDRFPDPDAFRRWALKRAEGRELRRAADVATKTPFNSYNLRIYRQTWWGIVGVLAPLLAARSIIVPPFQSAGQQARPILLEACPACALKQIRLYPQYKGRDAKHRAARGKIVAGLIAGGWLAPVPRRIETVLLDNAGGDALDAVIAGLIAAYAEIDLPAGGAAGIEGWIWGELPIA